MENALSIFHLLAMQIPEIPYGSTVCWTSSCLEHARYLKKNMDETVNPCDNFYQFSCGGFIDKNIIPDDRSTISQYSLMFQNILNILKNSLEYNDITDESNTFKIGKQLYKTCMDKNAIETEGIRPLFNIIHASDWPVLLPDINDWKENEFEWTESIYKLSDLGLSVNYFMEVYVDVDMKNTTNRLLYINEPFSNDDYTSSRLYYQNYTAIEKWHDNYYNDVLQYMIDILVSIGVEFSRAEKEMVDTAKFFIALQTISFSTEYLSENMTDNNRMTVLELSEKYPSIPWNKYLNRLLPSSVQLDSTDVVLNMDPFFMNHFENLINSTPKRALANYILIRAVIAYASYVDHEIKNIYPKFTKFLNVTKAQPKWKSCIEIVKEKLPISIAALYIQNQPKTINLKNDLLTEMLTKIINQLEDTIQKVDWMDNKTKKEASKKLAYMTNEIAYPTNFLNDTKYMEFYNELDISKSNYFEAILKIDKFNRDQRFSQLREPIDKKQWMKLDPTEVNAWYLPTANKISIADGILQGVFFDPHRPNYMNYGITGGTFGHEIIHGFDDNCRLHDENGNYHDWWSLEVANTYLNKIDCLTKQYDNYTVKETGQKVNGLLTQNENIADNIGIKLAYLAYQNWSAVHGQEEYLPMLKYTPNQLFWLSAANRECAKNRPEIERILSDDPHSPSEFRILGSFSNSPEFSKDFNCPMGSNMNPINKCTIW